MEIMNKEIKREMNTLDSDFSWSNWYRLNLVLCVPMVH
jgi:hypothetical protein